MKINGMSFNQDATCLTCSTNEGYVICTLKPKIECVKKRKTAGGIGSYKMIYDTNISAILGGGDTPFYPLEKVIIYDENDSSDKMAIKMSSEVTNVIVSRSLIVVCLRAVVFAYDFKGNLIARIKTIDNPNGICALNKSDETPILATLGSQPGDIFVLDILNKRSEKIKAHNSSVTALCINNRGNLIATGSENGTLIRVFDFRSTKKMYEFRRGSVGSKIHDITFNKESDLIACSSGNGTVHIFQLTADIDNTDNTVSSLSSVRNFLPTFFSSQWSFKQIRLDTASKIIVAFDDSDILHIATYDGKYYKSYSKFQLLSEADIPCDLSSLSMS